eukprot:TRINITY_DN2870_c2_g1_i7.p1 TRINITY_DN2870_c2_g1~~TRINITY_DN2870_c2_g1_i7.p1  ORF type:complete len:593 (+),score=151.25 TRINITY_DN2870_c2_g1_i7:353-2131(+)
MEGSVGKSHGGGGLNAEVYLSDYRLGKTLGIGSFGKVKVAEHVLTGHKVAIKILNRKKVKQMDMEEKVTREIKILKMFMHPHIIRLYEIIESSTDIFLIMEYVKAGELFDYIVEKGRLPEDEARRYFQQIISGVEYCHRNMVVHRDLKPENLLLDASHNVKIADFGLSNVMMDGHMLKTSCGSPNYAAPEVISGKRYAGPEVDVWSCGVILYALLCGSLPFDDENIPNLFKKIKGGVYTVPGHLSSGARDLIPRMLVVDPLKRITIPEIRHHAWFVAHLPRYLAVPAPDASQKAKRVDEEVVRMTVKLGFDRQSLMDSLRNRAQTKATVAYYLLLDSRQRMSSTGYMVGEFNEDKGGASAPQAGGQWPNVFIPNQHQMPWQQPMNGFTPCTCQGDGHSFFLQQHSLSSNRLSSPSLQQQRVVAEHKWQLGLQSRMTSSDIVRRLLRCLQELDVRWKVIGSYNFKCRWVAPAVTAQAFLNAPVAHPSYHPLVALPLINGHALVAPPLPSAPPPYAPIVEPMLQERRSHGGRTFAGGEVQVEAGEDESPYRELKFEVQVYKQRDERYMVDVQRLQGPHLRYLDFMAALLHALDL